MIEAILNAWRLVSPYHRRIARKRDLELVLKHHGLTAKRADRIATHFFSRNRKQGTL